MTLDELIDAAVAARDAYGGDAPVYFGRDAFPGAYVRAAARLLPARVAIAPTEPLFGGEPVGHYLSSRRPGARSGALSVVLEG